MELVIDKGGERYRDNKNTELGAKGSAMASPALP